ncbi:MAG TPA: TetR/AcrR family transcriptional regulator [Paraburkholderia sp.]
MDRDRKTGPGGRLPQCEVQARLHAVIEVATARFLSIGYRETSLDDIAREAGVAKKTLYCHFGSKALLFNAILRLQLQVWLDELRHLVIKGGEPADVLEDAALHLLDIGTREDMTELYRVLLVETRRFPALADGLYDQRGRPIGLEPLEDYLRSAVVDGQLELDDIELATDQFVQLVLGAARTAMLLGRAPRPGDDRRRAMAKQAVRIFLGGCAAP